MIKNLTAALPELGKIKSGIKGAQITSKTGKEFRPPQKLDHFIITGMERNEKGDLIPDIILMDSLKKSKSAKIDKNGNIVGIPIRLLYNDIELNFPTRYACYVSSKCVCSGDGEKATTRDGREVKCPCDRQSPGYQGKDKCKINGKLYCVIDGTTSIGACHVLRTTSFNTVQSIIGGLSFIQAAAGGMLAFLPLQLVLMPKSTVIPDTGAPVTVYVASIIYNGSIDDLRKTALGMAQDKAKYLVDMDTVEQSARQLMASVVESEEEQREVQEEFYPDAVDAHAVDMGAKPKGEVKPESETKPDGKTKSEEKAKPETKPKKDVAKNESKPESESKPKSKSKTKTNPPAKQELTVDDVVEEESDPEQGAEVEVVESYPKNLKEVRPSVATKSQASADPITDDQKRQIVKLKKALGITDQAEWEGLINKITPNSTSALSFTAIEANAFIEILKKANDIPF